MATLTHRQARRLIQLAADGLISPEQSRALELHLPGCAACRGYQLGLAELGEDLKRLTREHWERQRPPEIQPAAMHPARAAQSSGMVFGAAAGALVLIVFFVLGYLGLLDPFEQAGGPAVSTPAAAHTPGLPTGIPTPAVELVQTGLACDGCEDAIYVVQAGDTLAGIAEKFGLSEAAIQEYNHLQTDRLTPGTELAIPVRVPTWAAATITPTKTMTLRP